MTSYAFGLYCASILLCQYCNIFSLETLHLADLRGLLVALAVANSHHATRMQVFILLSIHLSVCAQGQRG